MSGRLKLSFQVSKQTSSSNPLIPNSAKTKKPTTKSMEMNTAKSSISSVANSLAQETSTMNLMLLYSEHSFQLWKLFKKKMFLIWILNQQLPGKVGKKQLISLSRHLKALLTLLLIERANLIL